MEAFSLLKFWRRGEAKFVPANAAGTTFSDPTIVAAVTQNVIETDDDDNVDDGGPFFDLEFRFPDDSRDGNDSPDKNQSDSKNSPHDNEEDEDKNKDNDDDEFDCGDGEREFKFVLSSPNNDPGDPNLALSSSDDLFFEGKLVQVDPSSSLLTSFESNSKPHFTASLLKSATKFRVFISGLKKSKSNTSEREPSGPNSVASKQPQTQSKQPESVKKQPEQQQQKKFYTVKFKFEVVPIMSVFNKNNSSKRDSGNKSPKQNVEDSARSATDEKHFSKEMMQKYLKMVKPLYLGVSRRYDEKQRQLSVTTGGKAGPPSATAVQKHAAAKPTTEKIEADAAGSEMPENDVKSQKRGSLPAGVRVVCKHLGKSRSASPIVVVAPSGMASSRRRDDSLLQQEDGIQGAILHCKRSLNGSREREFSQPPLSESEPLHEISKELSEKAIEKSKDS